MTGGSVADPELVEVGEKFLDRLWGSAADHEEVIAGLRCCGVLSGGLYGDRTPHGQWFVGTSMAAPHVTGVAALVKAEHPDKTAAEIADCIQASTVGRPVSLPTRDYTGREIKTQVASSDIAGLGIIDAEAAVRCPAPDPDTVIALTAGGSHTCALRDSGTVACWGDSWDGCNGQLIYSNGGQQ